MKVDWSSLPIPEDDGQADHLINSTIASISLLSTDDKTITLSQLPGKTVVYIYPRTGQPGKLNPEGWDMIPGARGCTPQSCSFRDHANDLQDLGINHIFGLSTQDTEYQKEASSRLHLPFPLLSDEKLELTMAMRLPSFHVDEAGTLLRRMVLIIENGKVTKVFYPVFPPEGSAKEVVDYLKAENYNASQSTLLLATQAMHRTLNFLDGYDKLGVVNCLQTTVPVVRPMQSPLFKKNSAQVQSTTRTGLYL